MSTVLWVHTCIKTNFRMHGMCEYIISAFSALEEMSHAPMMIYACFFNFVASGFL